jgi:hypothetical protein
VTGTPGVGERATPFFCPYCADEDLRPDGETGGRWRCNACARVFSLHFVGLSFAGGDPNRATHGSMSTNGSVSRTEVG